MSKKPHKAEEAAAPYTAKKPVQEGVRKAKVEDVRKANAKLIQVHRAVLQKLAQ